jgi:hypothetical protein
MLERKYQRVKLAGLGSSLGAFSTDIAADEAGTRSDY